MNRRADKLLKSLSMLVLMLTMMGIFYVRVNAADSTAIVMTYNGTTYSKLLYDVEVEMIKNGIYTDGLKNIGEMCDNISVLTGGTVTIDKNAVINTVKGSISAGQTSININLAKYEKGAGAGSVMPQLPATNDLATANVDAATGLLPESDVIPITQPIPPALSAPKKPASYSAAMNDYYKHAVFIGDSIMVGFRNYSMRAKDSYLANTNFLAAVSYSIRNALREGSNLHPTYKGSKQPVWKSIESMDVDRVFIMFGMNDISAVGVDKSCDNYVELIGKIKKVNPNIEVNIISMTNVLAGHEGSGLNNDKVREFNNKLRQLCAAKGWGFCDLAPYLIDQNGALASTYCSDNFVHQTNKAYSDVWEPFFYNYAVSRGVK